MARVGWGGSELRSIALLLAAWLGAARVGGQSGNGDAADARVYLPKAVDVAAVREALAGARRRLASPSCQALFTEFAGADGRPLAEALQALGEDGASYLGLLSFYNGDGSARCQQRQL